VIRRVANCNHHNEATMNKRIKRCTSCDRKQYVQSAQCICGFVPYEDTLNDETKHQLRMDQINRKLDQINRTLRTHFLLQAYKRWHDLIQHLKRLERKHNYISVHSTYQSRKDELKKYLQDRHKDKQKHHAVYNPFPSLREKAEQQGYMTELATGLERRKHELVQEDLQVVKQEYLKRVHREKSRSMCTNSAKASAMLCPIDHDQRREIVKQKPLMCGR
jgi:hypothetical protein